MFRCLYIKHDKRAIWQKNVKSFTVSLQGEFLKDCKSYMFYNNDNSILYRWCFSILSWLSLFVCMCVCACVWVCLSPIKRRIRRVLYMYTSMFFTLYVKPSYDVHKNSVLYNRQNKSFSLILGFLWH